MKKSLVLTGMMGVGKSTIGKSLSLITGKAFIDLDNEIKKKEGKTIKEIFHNKGEKYFRQLEKNIAINELKNENKIVALGGGAFMNAQIRECVIINCKSFWLNVSMDILKVRLKKKSSNRPLLDNLEIKDNLQKILNERKNIYKLANYEINCDNKKVNEIAKEILVKYEK